MSAVRVKVHLGAEPAFGLPAMVGYSVAGHLVAFIIIVLAPHFAPTGPPLPRILAGEIVSLPPPAGVPAGAPRPAEPAAAPRSEPAPKAPPSAPKKPREVVPPEPGKQKAAVEEPVKKGSAKTEETPAHPAEPAPAAAGPIAEGVGLAPPAGDASGIPSLNSAAFPYDWYRTTIVNLIRSRWRRPLTPGLTQPLRCTISFVISRGGALSEIAMASPSGFGALDLSALRAVTESSPLPQLPYQYTSDSIRGELVFELTPD